MVLLRPFPFPLSSSLHVEMRYGGPLESGDGISTDGFDRLMRLDGSRMRMVWEDIRPLLTLIICIIFLSYVLCFL